MDKAKSIYICSAAHSGSTILELLLSGHPQITSLGEVLYLPREIERKIPCTCGEQIVECLHWIPILNEIKASTEIDMTLSPYRFYLGDIAPLAKNVSFKKSPGLQMQHLFHRAIEFAYFSCGTNGLVPLPSMIKKGVNNTLLLYNISRKMRKKPIIVDSSKRYLKALELYKASNKTVLIILLIRDGRSVFASNLKRGHSLSFSLSAWKNYYQRGIPLINKHVSPEHFLVVRFEDMLENPVAQLERICRFVGLKEDYTEEMLRFNRFNLHSTGGNWTRFDRQIVLRRDKGWKEQLSAKELEYFEKKAWKLNEKLGYPNVTS